MTGIFLIHMKHLSSNKLSCLVSVQIENSYWWKCFQKVTFHDAIFEWTDAQHFFKVLLLAFIQKLTIGQDVAIWGDAVLEIEKFTTWICHCTSAWWFKQSPWSSFKELEVTFNFRELGQIQMWMGTSDSSVLLLGKNKGILRGWLRIWKNNKLHQIP